MSRRKAVAVHHRAGRRSDRCCPPGRRPGGVHPAGPGGPSAAPVSVQTLRDLQRTVGNAAVAGLVGQRDGRTAVVQRKSADPTAPKTVRLFSKGPAVEELQQHLNRHGADPRSIDGDFGNQTKAAVVAFQATHTSVDGAKLATDGVVGPLTWRALQHAAPSPPPPGGGTHLRDELPTILAKGDAMTPDEAARAKSLLFQLEGDEFRSALKSALASGAFMAMIAKLDAASIVDVFANLRMEVVVTTTLLNPAPDVIDTDFARANEIYNPKGVEVEKGNHIELSEKASRQLIGGNLSLDEFPDVPNARATAEELKLVEINRMKGRIAAYWVPAITSSRGEAVLKSALANLGDDRESVVVNAGSRARDTFAHEVGHSLGLPHDADPRT